MTSVKLLDLQQLSHEDPLQRLLAAMFLLLKAEKDLERALQVEREHSSGELDIT